MGFDTGKYSLSQVDTFANPQFVARNTDYQSCGMINREVTIIVHLMLNGLVGEQDFKHG